MRGMGWDKIACVGIGWDGLGWDVKGMDGMC
jgi:hypothetical protein